MFGVLKKLLLMIFVCVILIGCDKYKQAEYAISKGDLGTLKKIVESEDFQIQNNEGDSLLKLAVLYNNKELAQFLIDKGYDVNSINNKGTSLLSFACDRAPPNDIVMVELLVKNGAAINNKSPEYTWRTKRGQVSFISFDNRCLCFGKQVTVPCLRCDCFGLDVLI